MTGRAPGGVRVAAVDLGASSGRVMVARIAPDGLDLTEVHRFPNYPVDAAGTLYWDILALYRETLAGLRGCGPLDGIGVDSWAVDYGLLDGSGALLGNPVSYRDARTEGVMERVLAELGAESVYRTTGIQNLPFNTLFQLRSQPLTGARTMLLLPDLLGYWLTGAVGAEVTNASTTQLMDATSRQWSADLVSRAGIPPSLLPRLREPGSQVGVLRPAVAVETGLGPVPVWAVGSHDTASAVVGVPAAADFAYISSGTWSLVGVELGAPVLTQASREVNFSNEAGVDATVRYLRNVMGLWLLQECLREWSTVDLDDLLAAAAAQPGRVSMVDPDRPEFLAPGDMPARLAGACVRSGQPAPGSPAAYARCVLDSLALAHRRAIRDAVRLSGRRVAVVHMVGGGSANRLLCQLTADACGLPVVAGPVEATAWGNALIQARALGAVSGRLAELRSLLRAHVRLDRYEPRGDPAGWDSAERLAFGT